MTITIDDFDKVRAEYKAKVDGYRNDKTLSDYGKVTKIAQAWEETCEAIDRLREANDEEYRRELRSLQREQFGVTDSQMAEYRAALNNAAKAEDEHAAEQLLSRAKLVGDTLPRKGHRDHGGA